MTGADGPFGRNVGGDLEQVGLGMFDDFSVFIAQQPEEDLLSHVVEIRHPHGAFAPQEPAQRCAPTAKPLGEAAFDRAGHGISVRVLLRIL